MFVARRHASFQQCIERDLVFLFGEELGDRVGHGAADIRQHAQQRARRTPHQFQRSEPVGQGLGGRFADMADAEREQQALQRRRLAGGDRFQQVLGPPGGDLALLDGLGCDAIALVGQALHREQIVQAEAIQVRHAVDQVRFDQAVDVAVAQAFDVHHAPAREVANRFLALGGAGQAAGAACYRLAFLAHHVRAAYRTPGWQHVLRRFRRRTAFQHHAQHLGNHVAGAAHDHGVAHAHVLAPHFVFVVQRGVGDGDAADRYRHQARHRGDGAGTAHLHLDRLHRGQCFFGGEFMGQREARRTRDETERALVFQPVDFIDHAVDLVRQRLAARADVVVKIQQAVAAGDHGALFRDRQAETVKPVQHPRMRFGHVGAHRAQLELADAVSEEAQAARAGDARVQLAQTAGGGVARVGEFLLAGFALALVELLEVALEHQHFAAHFQHLGHLVPMQAHRDHAHGTDVGADVFAGVTVAARGGLHEAAVLVAQADRQAVEFEFGVVGDFALLEALAHAAVEVVDVLVGEAVVQRQHRHRVRHLAELGDRGVAHAPRRRIRGNRVRMLFLEHLQLTVQAVVFGVGDRRRVQHVIVVAGAVQFRHQPRDA